MLIGAHSIIYSPKPEADRAFLRRVLKLPSVDVGGGWLIFGLPPAEVAVHPSEGRGRHELFLICDDIQGFVSRMKRQRVECGPVRELDWGLLVYLTLASGGKLGVYQPKHKRPRPKSVAPRPGLRARCRSRRR